MTQCGGDLDFSMLRLCDIYLHCIRIISKYKKKKRRRRRRRRKEEEEGGQTRRRKRKKDGEESILDA